VKPGATESVARVQARAMLKAFVVSPLGILKRVFELPLTSEKESLEDGEIENVEKTMTRIVFASLLGIETNCFESEEVENIEKVPLENEESENVEKRSLEMLWRHWSCTGLPRSY
jgi:hypothetical protein